MIGIKEFKQINFTPHLGKSGLSIFEDYVSKAKGYLEYGSGGSTLSAQSLGAKHIISVDSSKEWHQAIKKDLNGCSNIDLIYCDIGAVGHWGKPINNNGIKNYHAYIVFPWQVAQEKNIDIDLILIDGRFRVACFLYSLICAQPGTTILFDDYTFRPRYHVVEEFCTKLKNHGRMAEFRVEKNFDLPALVAKICEYSVIVD